MLDIDGGDSNAGVDTLVFKLAVCVCHILSAEKSQSCYPMIFVGP